jgi:hypothetical protein
MGAVDPKSQVWDSKEQLDAFSARLMPILAETGIDPGEPRCSKSTTSSIANCLSGPAAKPAPARLTVAR